MTNSVDVSDFLDNDINFVGKNLAGDKNIFRKANLSFNQVFATARMNTTRKVIANPKKYLYYSDVIQLFCEEYASLSLSLNGYCFNKLSDVYGKTLYAQKQHKDDEEREG